MDTILKIKSKLKNDLWQHLLPSDSSKEQAAFLYCDCEETDADMEFQVLESIFLTHNDFAAQYDDYLELKDSARISLIKRAHVLGAVLVEIHSHPKPWAAAFSFSDRVGLEQTVPHMRWRLKRRPYIAIVVAPSGFDALIWYGDDTEPKSLTGIKVDDTLLTPTNITIGGWNEDSRQSI